MQELVYSSASLLFSVARFVVVVYGLKLLLFNH